MSALVSIITPRGMWPLISNARTCSACSAASSGVSANWTPPAFMRPPVRTCDLMTVDPPMSAACLRASSAVLAKPNCVVGMPARRTISRDSYSKKRIAAREPIGLASSATLRETRPMTRLRVIALSALVSALAPASASAVQVDLLTQANLRIDGAAAGEDSGRAVEGAGDVNGDGRDDLIIGALTASANGRAGSGSAYVVYGSGNQATLDLATGLSAARGFRIDGALPSDNLGQSVAGAGDVNNDGYDDVIVGAAFADNNARTSSGSSYVIYGAPTQTSIDLAAAVPASRGFQIDGAAPTDESGGEVSSAGNFNGDAYDDVIIGATSADNNGRATSGRVTSSSARRPGTLDLAPDGRGGASGSTAQRRASRRAASPAPAMSTATRSTTSSSARRARSTTAALPSRARATWSTGQRPRPGSTWRL